MVKDYSIDICSAFLEGGANQIASAAGVARRRIHDLLDSIGRRKMSFNPRRLRQLGNKISVEIKTDDEGYLGRECPQQACEGYFKVKPGTGLTGLDATCTCPYCGHTASPDEFWTKDQVEYAQSVALRQLTNALQADLKSLEFNHRPKGSFGIGVSLKVTGGRPHPIHHYGEKDLETSVTCANCTLDYAVFGVFGFCPDCAIHNSTEILERNLRLLRKQVALATAQEDRDLQRYLLEDALENAVSAFDGFARESCRVRATASTDPARCLKMSFQNLPRASSTLHQLFGFDLSVAIDSAQWTETHRAFMQRHLLAHKAGVIDQQYIDETGDPAAFIGRRVAVTSAQVRAVADAVGNLGNALISLLPPPR